MFKVLVIGGKCDGQNVVVSNEYERHAVLPEPILTPAQRVVDYCKGNIQNVSKNQEPEIYYLSRFILPEGMIYYLCNEPDSSQLCDWALGMIRDRLKKFEAQKKAGYYDL